MKKHSICLFLLIAIGFAGCVNVEDSIFHTQYEKSNWYNAGGYGDRMIQSDIYQVWFAANQLVRKEDVDYYALVRAAEVTILAGKEYFEVVSGHDVGQTIRYTTPGVAVTTSSGNATTVGSANATATGYGNSAQANVYGSASTTGNSTSVTTYTPPAANSVTFPKTLLTIRLLSQKTESAYSAKELLVGAKQKKLKLQVK